MKKYYKILSLLLAITIGLVACENGDQSSSNSVNAPEQAANKTLNMDTQQVNMTDGSNQEDTNGEQAYLIQNADLYFETLKYENAKQALLEVVEQSQGNIQYQNEYITDRGQVSDSNQELRELYLIARIPQEGFNQAVNKLQNLPDLSLQSASKGSEDVTRSINDIEIRLKAVEDRLDRLNDLLDQAEKIEEIIQIQTEIENAIVQRDQYLAEQANLENQIAQATITITLSERYVIAEERNENYSFMNRVVITFKEALVGTKWIIENSVLLLIASLPLIVIFLVVYLLYRLLFKKRYENYRRKHPKNKKVNRMLNPDASEKDQKNATAFKQDFGLDETDEKANQSDNGTPSE